MNSFFPFRKFSHDLNWSKGDVLALFGELFQRGYANGLVEEAEKRNMTLVKGTVGRRDKEKLRPLSDDELSGQSRPFINIPLEAGFDLEKADNGLSPVDQMKDIKLGQWAEAKLDWNSIEQSKQQARHRFKGQVKQYLHELEKQIAPGRNFLLAHLMAGGVPRAKIIMPLMNRSFKGLDDRYLSSESFWTSDLGKLCALNFLEVTAETFDDLIQLSSDFRKKVETAGGAVRYLAYGYHGTEIVLKDKLIWQTYTPYLQGWAKKRLEQISQNAFKNGIMSSVYNCPEILTNSSSIFQGVELSLYPLMTALEKWKSPKKSDILSQCEALLKDEFTYADVLNVINSYYDDPHISSVNFNFENWPQHNNLYLMNKMLRSSDQLIEMHKNPKELLTNILSEAVFKACGCIMLKESFKPINPVYWIGHDAVAQNLT